MKTDRKAVVSLAGYRALRNIAAGRDSWDDLKGRAVMGGHKSTLMALRRAGLVTLGGQLTDAGHKALTAAKKGRLIMFPIVRLAAAFCRQSVTFH